MGGVFYRKSEIITPTEFNAFCDPEALKIVLDSGVPITMVGLDVTMQVLVEAPQFAELEKIDTPLGKVVVDWLKFYEKLHRNSMGVGGALHDPLALAVVIDPTLIRTKPVHIGVNLGRHLCVRRHRCRFLERARAKNPTPGSPMKWMPTASSTYSTAC